MTTKASRHASTSQLGNDPRFDVSRWDTSSTKRARKVAEPASQDRHTDASDAGSEEEDEEEGSEEISSEEHEGELISEGDADLNEDDEDDASELSQVSASLQENADTGTLQPSSRKKPIVKPLSEEELAAYEEKRRKRGIVYISRIPYGMTVAKVRHLLGGFGDVERLYLQDGREKEQGQKLTGRKAKTAHFTEGWVEFVDKRVAKAVAEMLNAQPIGAASGGSGGGKGGKKAGGHGFRRWKDEVWTMKYLSGFKWYMLSEQLANERASRASRVRAELSQSAHEQKDYLRKVERARVMREKDMRRRARDEKAGEQGTRTAGSNGQAPKLQTAEQQQGKERSFRQREAITRDVREMRTKRGSDDGEGRAAFSKRSKSSHSVPARDDSRAQALQGAMSKIF